MRLSILLALIAGLAGGPAWADDSGRALYQARCAGCHGADARGGTEGGVAVPAIDWPTLSRPQVIDPARPAYGVGGLAQAVTMGADPAGRRLALPMARFALSTTELTSLEAYLAVAGTAADLEPGVTQTEIRVGTVLPLSGPAAAAGRRLQAAIEAKFAAAGPIYGRTLRLVTEDSGTDPGAAVARLARRNEVLALVGTLLPANAATDLPVVGTLDDAADPTHPEAFSLVATTEDQMATLVDALAAERPRLRLAAMGEQRGVEERVRRDGGSLVAPSRADVIVAAPGQDPLQLIGRAPPTALIAGRAADLVPRAGDAGRLRLVSPVATDDPVALAAGAAEVLIEGVKRMGARPTRARLIAALETLQDFPVTDLPPQSFGRGRHVGTRASVVLNSAGGRTAVWRVPKE
jgi:ABC-type branched-subunit amino acid transport system substrate-binding protein